MAEAARRQERGREKASRLAIGGGKVLRYVERTLLFFLTAQTSEKSSAGAGAEEKEGKASASHRRTAGEEVDEVQMPRKSANRIMIIGCSVVLLRTHPTPLQQYACSSATEFSSAER